MATQAQDNQQSNPFQFQPYSGADNTPMQPDAIALFLKNLVQQATSSNNTPTRLQSLGTSQPLISPNPINPNDLMGQSQLMGQLGQAGQQMQLQAANPSGGMNPDIFSNLTDGHKDALRSVVKKAQLQQAQEFQQQNPQAAEAMVNHPAFASAKSGDGGTSSQSTSQTSPAQSAVGGTSSASGASSTGFNLQDAQQSIQQQASNLTQPATSVLGKLLEATGIAEMYRQGRLETLSKAQGIEGGPSVSPSEIYKGRLDTNQTKLDAAKEELGGWHDQLQSKQKELETLQANLPLVDKANYPKYRDNINTKLDEMHQIMGGMGKSLDDLSAIKLSDASDVNPTTGKSNTINPTPSAQNVTKMIALDVGRSVKSPRGINITRTK